MVEEQKENTAHSIFQVSISHFIECLYSEKYKDKLKIVEDKKTQGRYIISNYTNLQNNSKDWDPITSNSRGIVIDKIDKKIVALSFPKFDNYKNKMAQNQEIDFITIKYDGSLGICFFDKITQKWRFCSRNSFDCIHSEWAENWLYKNSEPENFNQDCTYLFEIVYAKSKVHVTYDFEGLILLTIYHNLTGIESSYEEADVFAHKNGIQHTEKLSYTLKEAILLSTKISANEEGWVFKFKNGFRVKIKGKAYLQQLKKKFAQEQDSTIDDLVFQAISSQGGIQNIEKLKEEIKDDEIFEEIDTKTEQYFQQFNQKFQSIQQISDKYKDIPDNELAQNLKDNEQNISKNDITQIYFVRKQKIEELKQSIWNQINPEYNKNKEKQKNKKNK